MHRGHTTPVHFFGAIGFGYKSSLVHIHGTGKNGAFKQVDYLGQVLEPYIQSFLEAFRAICGTPQFMEDGNAAHGHKSTINICARQRAEHSILLFPHPAISPDMNPIEKCWRRIKQAIHRRQIQPTDEAQIVIAVTEEWEKIPQEWIDNLIRKQDYWVQELVKRRGWSTPN
jgi:transposase